MAYLTDAIILQLLYVILLLAGVVATNLAAPDGVSPNGIIEHSFFPLTMAWFALFFSYFIFFHSYCGQTPGKILVRIIVVGEDGKPLPPFLAFIRSLGYFISSIFLVGYLLALFEKRGRALHDLLARSEVVQS